MATKTFQVPTFNYFLSINTRCKILVFTNQSCLGTLYRAITFTIVLRVLECLFLFFKCSSLCIRVALLLFKYGSNTQEIYMGDSKNIELTFSGGVKQPKADMIHCQHFWLLKIIKSRSTASAQLSAYAHRL